MEKRAMMRTWRTIDIRLRAALVALPLIGLAIALPIAWYLLSPLFINQMVDEGFPVAAAPAPPQPANAGPAEPADPTATPGSGSGPVTAAPAAGQPAAAPAILASGQFGAIDAGHKGEGKATIFRLPEGGQVLRFEDFRVTNGPDLYVYLAAHPAPRTTGQLHEGVAFEVARRKGNAGSQNYELPAGLDLSQFASVVIYCKRFSVVFSTVELAPSAGTSVEEAPPAPPAARRAGSVASPPAQRREDALYARA